MNNFKKISEEIFYPNYSNFYLNSNDISDLISYSNQCVRGRARICAHQSPNSVIHEMFIVHKNDSYVRPHRHIKKSESMLVLQGEVDFIVYNNEGTIIEKIPMGDFSSGKCFYHNMSESLFHSIRIKSEKLVFLEVTSGPFDPAQSEFAPWSPTETEAARIETFFEIIDKFEVNNG